MSSVRTQSAIVAGMAADWDLADCLLGGTPAMRAAGKSYLPQWPAEADASYRARIETATLFPAFARTLSVLAGKPFSKPLALSDDAPARVREWCDDVDLQGRNLHAFAADVARLALGHGLAGILVDYPPSAGVRSVADERASGARPYMVAVRPQAILGWRSDTQAGARRLTQLRLLESVEVPDGPWGTGTVEQVRVLEPGRWQTWRRAGDDWLPHDEGATTLPLIPFVPVYGERADFMVGRPPLRELGWMNVEHWQSKSDQQTILHVARVPILFARMLGAEDPIHVGAGSFVRADAPDADLRYVEHSGRAIEAGRLSLLDLEDRMRQAGAELLVIKPGNVTEAQTLADAEAGASDLQRFTTQLEDSLNQALHLMARWVGEPSGGTVSLYRDFGAATLAEASAELLRQMHVDGALSQPTLLGEMKRRGILAADVDVAEEVARTAGVPEQE